MAGPLAQGATEFEAKVAAFVRDNRLYGAAACGARGRARLVRRHRVR